MLVSFSSVSTILVEAKHKVRDAHRKAASEGEVCGAPLTVPEAFSCARELVMMISQVVEEDVRGWLWLVKGGSEMLSGDEIFFCCV